jgi:hypothetical protein
VIVERLESLFTANIADLEKGVKAANVLVRRFDGTTANVDVTADVSQAEASLDDVNAAVRELVGADAEATVTADTAQASRALAGTEAELHALDGSDAEVHVTADTSAAEQAIDQLPGEASEAGGEAGDNMAGKIVAALATIPVAGAIIGIGAAIGDQLMSGLENEVRSDRFMAQTGLDERTAATVGRAAAEAYANNFGESIAANIDTARTAIQGGLLDPAATKVDAQAVVEQLSGVADILGEDIPAVSRAATQAIRTGLARDAAGAFDLIVKGQQVGLNASEDWLDTLDEYGTSFRTLGLEGPQALGLLRQAVQGGARDTDQAADALKEFSLRAQDLGDAAAGQAFVDLGLNADEMRRKIAGGGDDAAAALDLVLDKLRAIKDPAEQNAAAVALFGTQAEDMGDALYSMDLSNAVEQLGAVEGAARSAIETLGDNSAGDLESAKRNLEVAADGIAGALATAFSPQIEGFAEFVSSNREAVLSFMLDAANGAIDFGRAAVEGAAAATEGFGSFVADVGPGVLDTIESILAGLDRIPGVDLGLPGIREDFDRAREAMADFEDGTSDTADTMRSTLIEGALDPAQQKLNDLAVPMLAEARLNDTTKRLAAGIDGVGYAANGAKLELDGLDYANLRSSESGRLLDDQVRGVVDALYQQVSAAAGAGESQDQLRERVASARQAFIDQATAMGVPQQEAEKLANKYGLIPDDVTTRVRALDGATRTIGEIRDELGTIRDKTVTIAVRAAVGASVARAQAAIRAAFDFADGGITVRSYAGGGIEPPHLATIVPAGAYRLMAEDETGGEAYIPLAPTKRARSELILEHVAAMFGHQLVKRADGAVDGGASSVVPALGLPPITFGPFYGMSAADAPRFASEVTFALRGLQRGGGKYPHA